MAKIKINTESIKNRLKSYSEKPALAILEYIWNGFDADANNVYIKYDFPEKIGDSGFGYPNFEIQDDGIGWNIENSKSTNLFLVSSKISKPNKSLPQGKDEVGRFTFYSFANKATWETIYDGKKYRLSLESDKLDDYTLDEGEEEKIQIKKGTRVLFNISSEKITESFLGKELVDAIKLEFCWFLKLYPNKKIFINDKQIDVDDIVNKKADAEISISDVQFSLTLVQWKVKPTRESSRYYFIGANGEESFAKTTGLNYQSDDFYHSVYVKSDFFNDIDSEERLTEEDRGALPLASKGEKKNRAIYNKLLEEIRKRLESMRKPFLRKLSQTKIEEWKITDTLPEVKEFGLTQKEYEKIVKEVYITTPQLFKNCSEDQRKVILRLIPALLSSDEKESVLKILDEVYKLSSEDKKALAELLQKTTLSHVVKTVKEIDDRLSVLAALETILLDRDLIKFTKEVDHLQRTLDENFWIFGEDYRLLANAEGSIRKTLNEFKTKILRQENVEVKTKSRKELDIFLAKVDETSNNVSCIVVEIKRPSVKLGKKQYDQIYEYMNTIVNEPSCNGSKMEWKFYLIGTEYDSYIEQQINSAKTWGEKNEGLAFVVEDKRTKLYVKKWSDIINVEQKSRYSFLKDKLEIKMQDIKGKSPSAIVKSINKKVKV